MQKFQLQSEEHLLVNDPHTKWMRGLTPIAGQLKLTEKRIVFVKNATPFLKLFLKSQGEEVLHDISLSSIKNYSLVDFGKTKRLLIETGISLPLTFATPKFEIFAGELKRLMGK
jgi:hypothetical protein